MSKKLNINSTVVASLLNLRKLVSVVVLLMAEILVIIITVAVFSSNIVKRVPWLELILELKTMSTTTCYLGFISILKTLNRHFLCLSVYIL